LQNKIKWLTIFMRKLRRIKCSLTIRYFLVTFENGFNVMFSSNVNSSTFSSQSVSVCALHFSIFFPYHYCTGLVFDKIEAISIRSLSNIFWVYRISIENAQIVYNIIMVDMQSSSANVAKSFHITYKTKQMYSYYFKCIWSSKLANKEFVLHGSEVISIWNRLRLIA
jgi:hypothetical protein